MEYYHYQIKKIPQRHFYLLQITDFFEESKQSDIFFLYSQRAYTCSHLQVSLRMLPCILLQ